MSERLRIAQVAPIAGRVRPGASSSIEHVVSLLTEELVARGHDVTLFATGESETSARLSSIYRRGYNDDPALWEWTFHELLHVAAAVERADDFDVIHSHVYHFALPFTRLVRTPIVHTYHVLANEDVVRGYGRYPETTLVAISEFQRSQVAELPHVPVVHHGVDVDSFPFGADPGDHLNFLGELSWEKGAAQAIELARAAGRRLVVAGRKTERYDERLDGLLREPHVEFVGAVKPPERDELLAGAAALVYPIHLPESFGLVPVEAMSCGTPVLALGIGAVPELVEDGVTGFVRSDLDSLTAAAADIDRLDRATVRARTRARFDHRRMASDYEVLYARLAARSRHRRSA